MNHHLCTLRQRYKSRLKIYNSLILVLLTTGLSFSVMHRCKPWLWSKMAANLNYSQRWQPTIRTMKNRIFVNIHTKKMINYIVKKKRVRFFFIAINRKASEKTSEDLYNATLSGNYLKIKMNSFKTYFRLSSRLISYSEIIWNSSVLVPSKMTIIVRKF